MMVATNTSDVQLIAPALLQLNRGDKSSPSEPCPSPTCGASISSFPDCLECRNSTNLNLQCDSCWTDCASPCNDDDCHIPQPCYDEHCSVDSCVDSTCAAESCMDVTCAETVHCNATCFDSNCIYDFGDETSGYDSLNCGQGHCFGFVPTGPGLDGFDSSSNNDNDILHQRSQAISTASSTTWSNFIMPEQTFQHDHVAPNNRRKRRRVEPSEYPDAANAMQIPCWSDNHFDGVFSQEDFDVAFNHALSSSHAMPSTFDFSECQGTCHHQLKRNMDDWADDLASGLPCHFTHDKCSHPPQPTVRRHKRASAKPAKLLPAPDSAQFPANGLSFTSQDSQQSQEDTTLDFVCQWVTDLHTGTTCNHRFTCAQDLDTHLQTAHTSKLNTSSFTCQWIGCNTTFKHRGKLNRHIAGAHSKYRAHACTHIDPLTHAPCGRTFCTKEQLRNHETTHTGERRFKCRYCDHTSATKTQHNTHERIHTKEKPYRCPWCEHCSGDSSNLSKHIRNKHPGMAGRTAKKGADWEEVEC